MGRRAYPHGFLPGPMMAWTPASRMLWRPFRHKHLYGFVSHRGDARCWPNGDVASIEKSSETRDFRFLPLGSRHRTAVAHRVRARMARCSARGPCAAVRWGRQARRGVDRDVGSFSPGQDALSKSPAPPHGLAGQGCPASAKWGGLLFWLLFSWPRKRKVTRAAQRLDRSCSTAVARALLLQRSCLQVARYPRRAPAPRGELAKRLS
jgi:hypothetical protein